MKSNYFISYFIAIIEKNIEALVLYWVKVSQINLSLKRESSLNLHILLPFYKEKTIERIHGFLNQH